MLQWHSYLIASGKMALRPVALHAISHINCEQHRTALPGLSDHYTYAGYIDLRAAFDCFSRPALWLLPTRLHVPDRSVRLIKAFYDKSGSCVRIYWRSPELVVSSVCQGCVADPESRLICHQHGLLVRKVTLNV